MPDNSPDDPVDTFPCVVARCPWPAGLRGGVWLCERHDEGYVWDDEQQIIYPKIAEMDRRIRSATERLIRHLHLQPDAFAMLLELTNVAMGLEKRTKGMALPRGRGGIEV